jgi:putative transposase
LKIYGADIDEFVHSSRISTKNRANLITPEIEPELYAYIGGVLKKRETVLIAANGTANHVHLLISMSKNFPLSDLVREVKKASSLWIKQKGPEFGNFQWQSGYGAFSVGQTQVDDVKRYIARQKEKHKVQRFEDELVGFLTKYKIPFEEKYLWD